jgi:hypothetical protein
MKPSSSIVRLVAPAIVALVNWPAPVQAGNVLFTQPYDGSSPGVPSQIFTDTSPNYSTWSTQAFDDFTVTGPGWLVTGATFYGQDQGNPAQNVSINMKFLTAPSFSTSGISGGVESGGNLTFSNLHTFLAPGTYWITGWVDRPELTGGQWFWDITNLGKPIGSEFFIQNPGGGLLFDANGNPLAAQPTAGSTVFGTPPSDLAFTLFGSIGPEPSSMVLLAIGTLAAALAVWQARARGPRTSSSRLRPAPGHSLP